MTFTPHPWQREAFDTYARLGGLFVAVDPGVGKTFVAGLIGRAVPRPVLATPAPSQALAQLRDYGVPAHLAAKGPGEGVAIVTYAWLTNVKQAEWLEQYRPTDLLLDELHMARGLRHSARVRVSRYLQAHPSVRVAVFTASPMSHRVSDFAFGLRWALRSAVSDLLPSTQYGIERLESRLAEDPAAAAAFRRKLEAVPGVMLDVSAGAYTGDVRFHLLPVRAAEQLPPTWELPDGILLDSASAAARAEAQLAWGFYLRHDPPLPEWFKTERSVYMQAIRTLIYRGAADTPAEARPHMPELAARYDAAVARLGPVAPPVAEWLSTHNVDRAAEIVGDGPALVWARHRGLQDQLAATLGSPLHRSGCRNDAGALPDPKHGPAVLSINACYQSWNLQAFRRSVVLEQTTDPEVYKQLIGRTARQGQQASSVDVDLVLAGPAAVDMLHRAVDAATLVFDTTGKRNVISQLVGTNWQQLERETAWQS